MICTEVGDTEITAYDKDTGRSSKAKITNVPINEAFPFHSFSEIVAGERGAKCLKQHGSWSFSNDAGFILHGSQQMNSPAAGKGANKLYWIDEQKATAVVNVSRTQDKAEHMDVWGNSSAESAASPSKPITKSAPSAAPPSRPASMLHSAGCVSCKT